MISVVCPFFNEASIIEASVRRMLVNLRLLDREWELIIVNDGSTDGSFVLAQGLAREEPRLRVLGYAVNRGRGRALRIGIAAARGELIVTTEIDSSWGDDIVRRLADALERNPHADMVIASPNLPGGGYRNVPRRRVLVSRLGNVVLRTALDQSITMYTGMTRGYRRAAIQKLPLDEDEKEFHLEVIRKARAFGYRIIEIPAILEWQHQKLAKPGAATRKSSSRTGKLIRTHFLFSMVVAPCRYILPAAALLGMVATAFMLVAFYSLLFTEGPSIYYAMVSFFLYLFAFLLLITGILAQQNMAAEAEMWRVRSDLRAARRQDQDSAGKGSEESL
jgi:glycosyltransferase involved in cell wall biosynthesis